MTCQQKQHEQYKRKPSFELGRISEEIRVDDAAANKQMSMSRVILRALFIVFGASEAVGRVASILRWGPPVIVFVSVRAAKLWGTTIVFMHMSGCKVSYLVQVSSCQSTMECLAAAVGCANPGRGITEFSHTPATNRSTQSAVSTCRVTAAPRRSCPPARTTGLTQVKIAIVRERGNGLHPHTGLRQAAKEHNHA